MKCSAQAAGAGSRWGRTELLFVMVWPLAAELLLVMSSILRPELSVTQIADSSATQNQYHATDCIP